jgi:hypothetical protein
LPLGLSFDVRTVPPRMQSRISVTPLELTEQPSSL